MGELHWTKWALAARWDALLDETHVYGRFKLKLRAAQAVIYKKWKSGSTSPNGHVRGRA